MNKDIISSSLVLSFRMPCINTVALGKPNYYPGIFHIDQHSLKAFKYSVSCFHYFTNFDPKNYFINYLLTVLDNI